ncbi:hypothetical protein UYSO10_2728 [Kosakonia radicincitans]|uniref:hypothetical protein n=1 Tax=Kosakonia radicincitans TaxID=283686 RepID=UPI001183611D|nr:hypothetical protein [Kosakonia radicincitans]VVT49247.1 hypothetical protein UYSO10_2728 [Kosakonia radicincitans]
MDEKVIALATLKAAKDSAEWAFWSMIGTWVAGIATFMAVLVSLHLANRKSRPRLNADVSWVFIDNGLKTVSGVGITIANASGAKVVITGISWLCGSQKKLAQTFGHSLSTPMPTKLEEGESAFYFLEVGEEMGWPKTIIKNIKECSGKIEKLKLSVSMASGIKKTFKVKNLISMLNELDKR